MLISFMIFFLGLIWLHSPARKEKIREGQDRYGRIYAGKLGVNTWSEIDFLYFIQFQIILHLP